MQIFAPGYFGIFKLILETIPMKNICHNFHRPTLQYPVSQFPLLQYKHAVSMMTAKII